MAAWRYLMFSSETIPKWAKEQIHGKNHLVQIQLTPTGRFRFQSNTGLSALIA